MRFIYESNSLREMCYSVKDREKERQNFIGSGHYGYSETEYDGSMDGEIKNCSI